MKLTIIEKENRFWSDTKQKFTGDKDFSIFKTWDVVRSIPIYNPDEFYDNYRPEVEAIINETNSIDRWSNVLREPFFGHTEESWKQVDKTCFDGTVSCTPWTLKTAHHILTYETKTGRSINDYDQIVDFGAGIGEMGRVIYDLGFKKDYYICDLPEVAKISSGYLNTLGHSPKIVENFNEIPNNKKTLFIATWSLSEVPFSYRNEIANYFRKQDFLIIFQQNVFEYNNTGYFIVDFPVNSETYVQLHQIPWHNGGNGNFYLFSKA